MQDNLPKRREGVFTEEEHMGVFSEPATIYWPGHMPICKPCPRSETSHRHLWPVSSTLTFHPAGSQLASPHLRLQICSLHGVGQLVYSLGGDVCQAGSTMRRSEYDWSQALGHTVLHELQQGRQDG